MPDLHGTLRWREASSSIRSTMPTLGMQHLPEKYAYENN
jgi:hypothetical protein